MGRPNDLNNSYINLKNRQLEISNAPECIKYLESHFIDLYQDLQLLLKINDWKSGQDPINVDGY